MTADRNFDELADHFERRIYGGLKGRIRLAVLRRDLQAYLKRGQECARLSVLDTGAGLAQLAIELAEAGHRVMVNDLSARMLAQARHRAKTRGVVDSITWRQGPFQELVAQDLAGKGSVGEDLISEERVGESQYDLVLCHAVLEWLAQPEEAMATLAALVRPGGCLSLAFYNRDAQVFRNLVRGNFKKVQSGAVHGAAGGLTPQHPLVSDEVVAWLIENGLEVEVRSGIRVFRDYVTAPMGGHLDDDAVIDMELAWSQREPFWRLGRYIHLICRKH